MFGQAVEFVDQMPIKVAHYIKTCTFYDTKSQDGDLMFC